MFNMCHVDYLHEVYTRKRVSFDEDLKSRFLKRKRKKRQRDRMKEKEKEREGER